MNNEIGRKLTSLTIMAIMFAGGMTIAVPSFMPGVAADTEETVGMLTVSTTTLQGAAILEIVINDPDYTDTEIDLNDGPEVTIGGNDYITNQGANGKWYLYVVDESISEAMDADSNGMEYGLQCTTGIGTNGSANVIGDVSENVWVEGVDTSNTTGAGNCLDLDNMTAALDNTAGTTSRMLMSAAVLQNAPALSDHNEAGTDLGQRKHALNASGYGSWPYILSFELSSENVVEYLPSGDDITVDFESTSGDTWIDVHNKNPGDSTHIFVDIFDPALNIDPTTPDKWIFSIGQSSTVIFGNNGTNNTISKAEATEMQCEDNCYLTATNTSSLTGTTTVTMTESAANSAVFESYDINGTSEVLTIDEAVADTQITWTYDDEDVDTIVTYNDASVSLDAGSGDWVAGTAATYEVTDSDANRSPGDDETLEIYDETVQIPTIKMGTPLTLAGGANANLEAGDTNNVAGVTVGDSTGGLTYTLSVNNTTDNSERLRITASARTGGADSTTASTTTWINVTTGHTRDTLINLPGTVVLNYNVQGPFDDLSATALDVIIADSGNNSTNNSDGLITAVSAGSSSYGTVDLDDGTNWVKNTDVSDANFTTAGAGETGNVNLLVGFKFTHASGTVLGSTFDYAIAADFCNFDQDNGSNVHNCIYRMAAEETGEDTGVFAGTVEYVMLNNSTAAGTVNGEHNGNDEEVEDLIEANDSDLTVVIMDSVDGTDAIRVDYNDTDALQEGDMVSAQLDTILHSGTAELDADDYEDTDLATITITDADLNQDSSVRDVYQNSSRTFQMSIVASGSTVVQYPFATDPMTIIETTVDSGVFVGTFKVPNYNGSDMELTYYESNDAAGESVEIYDVATVTSNSGTISLDKSVYPVPFASGDLRQGDDTQTGQTESGNVTMTITVEDADFTGDTLSTGTGNSNGTILVKLIEGATTSTCFTAGSAIANDDTSTSADQQELGPLEAVDYGAGDSVFEVEFTLDEVQHCGANMRTVTADDVIQVSYVDASDDSGSSVTVYDSATFDLRTGSLSVDKDVYVLGSDMVVTLTDPDLNLDGGSIESYAMSILEWDSDVNSSVTLDDDDFTNNPSKIQETGEDTGVFQTVVTLPESQINSSTIDYGEEVILTYVDVGISGEDTTEDDTVDIEAYFSISNFGALVELDKAVYSWTDVVYFTITAPDHNVNSATEETIGTSDLPIQVTTRVGKMCSGSTYFADESGVDTGVFEGEVQLSGFDHTMSADQSYTATATACGSSNDGGTLKTASQTDGISVSYEYNDGSVVVASASIVWNIGEAYFDSSAVSGGGSAVVTVVDQDENLDDDIIDTFTVDVFSDSDNGGFTLTMNETNEDTGVFEGTIHFTTDLATSGTSLRVSEGDTVTAEYTDETLPEPYTTDDDLTIAATTTIGTAFPPLERAPAANARVVDAFGSSVAEVSVDQQVQIAADVSNGQDKDQAFAYLVQVQDGNGVTVSLAWITGSLNAGQSMSPALSWTPSDSGSYTATVFVWESVDNPTALSPTVSVDIDVV